MPTLYYDTETTGLPPRGPSPSLTDCPSVVQLAAILLDDDGSELHSINTIIQPSGWEVDPGASAIHGITTERAASVGIPGIIAFGFFSNLARLATETVAHNIVFDSKLMRWEMERLGKPAIHNQLPQVCTMLLTTPICRIPNAFGKYKWPKLTEAYEHFFGETFSNAHDALADVRACIRIHQHLKQNKLC